MQGEYVKTMLHSVPVSKDNPHVQYGIGVGIHKQGPFGASYGYGGWIPGYCSSLRYYPEHEVAVPFQINTDIEITDDSTPVIKTMEIRLAKVVINRLCK